VESEAKEEGARYGWSAVETTSRRTGVSGGGGEVSSQEGGGDAGEKGAGEQGRSAEEIRRGERT